MNISFRLNGQTVQTVADAQTPLLFALIQDGGVNGAKFGCGAAHCGACTVLLDGEPVKSCTVLAVQADGHDVTTVEGLGTPDRPHALMDAMVDAGAVQCGFCTPGFLTLATATLKRKPDIGEDELRDVLSSNLCRCTGYKNIVKAVQSVQAAASAGRE